MNKAWLSQIISSNHQPMNSLYSQQVSPSQPQQQLQESQSHSSSELSQLQSHSSSLSDQQLHQQQQQQNEYEFERRQKLYQTQLQSEMVRPELGFLQKLKYARQILIALKNQKLRSSFEVGVDFNNKNEENKDKGQGQSQSQSKDKDKDKHEKRQQKQEQIRQGYNQQSQQIQKLQQCQRERTTNTLTKNSVMSLLIYKDKEHDIESNEKQGKAKELDDSKGNDNQNKSKNKKSNNVQESIASAEPKYQSKQQQPQQQTQSVLNQSPDALQNPISPPLPSINKITILQNQLNQLGSELETTSQQVQDLQTVFRRLCQYYSQHNHIVQSSFRLKQLIQSKQHMIAHFDQKKLEEFKNIENIESQLEQFGFRVKKENKQSQNQNQKKSVHNKQNPSSSIYHKLIGKAITDRLYADECYNKIIEDLQQIKANEIQQLLKLLKFQSSKVVNPKAVSNNEDGQNQHQTQQQQSLQSQQQQQQQQQTQSQSQSQQQQKSEATTMRLHIRYQKYKRQILSLHGNGVKVGGNNNKNKVRDKNKNTTVFNKANNVDSNDYDYEDDLTGIQQFRRTAADYDANPTIATKEQEFSLQKFYQSEMYNLT